jgi:hypothetical protein
MSNMSAPILLQRKPDVINLWELQEVKVSGKCEPSRQEASMSRGQDERGKQVFYLFWTIGFKVLICIQ